MMCIYMLYLISSYVLTFVIVGATFSAIVIFLIYCLDNIFLTSGSPFLVSLATKRFTSQFLFGTYLFLLLLVMLISLTLPVDKGINYFRFTAIVFSLLSLLTVIGIVYYMCKAGW